MFIIRTFNLSFGLVLGMSNTKKIALSDLHRDSQINSVIQMTSNGRHYIFYQQCLK